MPERQKLPSEISAVTQELTKITEAAPPSLFEGNITHILDNISDGFVAIDDEWRYTYINAAAERLIGRPRMSLLGSNFWQDFSEITGTPIEQQLRRVASDHTSAELRIEQQAGSKYLWYKAHWILSGGMAVYFRDLSGRRHTERHIAGWHAVAQILATSSTLAEAAGKIIEALCDALCCDIGAFWLIDQNSHTLRCVEMWHVPTKAFPEFEAVSRQSIFSKGSGFPGRIWETGAAIWMPDEALNIYFNRHAAAAKENLHAGFGFPIRSKLEVLAVMEFFSDEIRKPSERLLRMVEATGSEIGQFLERQQVEKELSYKTQLLATITDNATSMLYMIDAEDRATYVNSAVERITGYTPAELNGKVMHDMIHHSYPDGRPFPVDECPLSRALKAGGVVRNKEDVFVRKDGTFFPVRCAASSIYRDGKPIGTVIEVQDITQTKRAEEALQKINLELEKRVASRAAELEQAHSNLLRDVEKRKHLESRLLQAQKLESVGTLAAGVAHDFNNILNVINSYASLLPIDNANSTATEGIRVISEMVQRGAALIQQLLSLSRKVEPKFGSVNVAALLRGLENLLNQTFPKNINVFVAVNTTLPSIMADDIALRQAMLGLCLNARDAMPHGGKLTIIAGIVEGARLREMFQDAKEEFYIRISFVDTGTGIPDAINARIFEPFFTTKEQGKSTGLGLSIAYATVTNHGGFIDVQSRPSYGANFIIYLPVSNMSAVSGTIVQKTLEPNSEEGNGEIILFVEDEDNQLQLMRGFLLHQGYRVLLARDGESAVDLYRQNPHEIALVILDMGLPKLDGWQVFKMMKEVNPEVKAILATGYVPESLESHRSEFCAIVSKPYLPTEILRNISAVLRNVR